MKKQGYNDKLDESLGARNKGKKSQSMKYRRDESKGEEKSKKKRAYSAVKTMDKKPSKSKSEKKDSSWIKDAIKKPNSLRKTLGAKKDKPIAVAKLKKAAAGKGVSPKTEKRAELALTLRKLNKKK